MCASDPRHGRYLTASAMFRGRMSTKEVDSPPSPSPPPAPLAPPPPSPNPPPMCTECDLMHNGATAFSSCLKRESGRNHCYRRDGSCPSDMTSCPGLASPQGEDPWGVGSTCKDKKM